MTEQERDTLSSLLGEPLPSNIQVLGIDEAGRGPWAGPVYAAAVLLSAHTDIPGINDSKKLSAAKRESLSSHITLRAAAYASVSASVEEIDRLNILEATFLAMERAVQQVRTALTPDTIIVIDGSLIPRQLSAIHKKCYNLPKADSLISSVAAASILAKLARDAHMTRLHAAYPQYNFVQHKGYGTAQHRALLIEHGVSPVHRRSFNPVRQLLLGE